MLAFSETLIYNNSCVVKNIANAPLAQLVEHLTLHQGVYVFFFSHYTNMFQKCIVTSHCHSQQANVILQCL